MRMETATVLTSDLSATGHVFRADTDQTGAWFVWRRLGANGWASLRRCASRSDAMRLAESLNGRLARQSA